MVDTAIEKNKEHITLKEAALLSGYSSDYLGQLIRKGKLHGVQVYSSVAWVTTHRDITEYLEKAKNGEVDTRSAIKRFFDKYLERATDYFLYFVITMLSVTVFVLFYIFVASIEGNTALNVGDQVNGYIQDYE